MDEVRVENGNFFSRVAGNWVLIGALSGVAGTALKSLLDGALTRFGISAVKNSEVTQRAVFGKPPRTAVMGMRRRNVGRSILGTAVEGLFGAALGTGISYAANKNLPGRSLLTGALIGAGVGILTMGVAGVRRTGVFSRSPVKTAGSLLLSSGLIGALTGWGLSLAQHRGFPMMSPQTGYPVERPHDEPPAEFVH